MTITILMFVFVSDQKTQCCGVSLWYVVSSCYGVSWCYNVKCLNNVVVFNVCYWVKLQLDVKLHIL